MLLAKSASLGQQGDAYASRMNVGNAIQLARFGHRSKSNIFHRWLLLPLPEMVDKLWDRRQKSMEAPTSAKQQPHIETPDVTGTSSPATAPHSYTFDTLPTLVSHLKLHSAICDAGVKLYHEITSGHSGLSQVAKLLWPVSEREATFTLDYIERVYGTWLRYEPHSTFASSPRTPLRLPSPDAYPRLPLRRRLRPWACLRPCFRSRFTWTPSLCARCQNGGVDSGASSGSGGDGDRAGLGPSEALSETEYGTHRRRLSLAWRSSCLESVRKRGGWAARVLNDGQLGGYADELPQTLDELCDGSILDVDATFIGP
ncbi:hypothetical protein HETIRDRAFT_423681 [Heterobasidion irregulare TC 32-1]|uniref:Uncharacterized protein n=1 Tax=Heterobasidion irregulare (strain TC 32-1) TaxID=747525 RepID=W4KM52_HETIT|nr:uncharacterized protein HETIRDRAFT_423681 [Heterobasidion irregulare TC 32-1]ETW86455.1 hypothetical protein HETIRDRAFT_423681 [Heterobasidion irregulare TC 32-1]